MRKNSSACDPLQGPFLGLFVARGPGQAGLAHVEGAWTSDAGTLHDMKIDHGGGDIGVAQKILDRANVDSVNRRCRR